MGRVWKRGRKKKKGAIRIMDLFEQIKETVKQLENLKGEEVDAS